MRLTGFWLVIGLFAAPALANDLFLEDVEGAAALQWVQDQNKDTLGQLQKLPVYQEIKTETLKQLNSKDRIAAGEFHNGFLYNFWRDEKHTRGILRRMSISDYLAQKQNWELVLDVDKLATDESENWVYYGAAFAPEKSDRAILTLSRGGTDAAVYREFDLSTKSFVQQQPFNLPEAKSWIEWLDEDRLLVSTDFGPDTLTDSGYPRQIRLWQRGTAYTGAKLLLEVKKTDVSVRSQVFELSAGQEKVVLLNRWESFFESEFYTWTGSGQPQLAPLPKDLEILGQFKNQMIVKPKQDWKYGGANQVLTAGTIALVNIEDLAKGNLAIEKFYEPAANATVENIVATNDAIYLHLLEDVRGKIIKYSVAACCGTWDKAVLDLPKTGSVIIVAKDKDQGILLVYYEDFLTPTSMYSYSEQKDELKQLASLPAQFDASDLEINQFWVKSADGTRVPYFQVNKKGLQLDGQNPTLLYGYGGFLVSLTPRYAASLGTSWLAKGGVYVLSNIRGGGEFGPKWHSAALKYNRHKAYDDFIAIAEDLIKRNVTTPRHLGIEGGSNGGLLTGVAVTRRPDLFNAALIQVPLLDMLRYHKLLAGASWVGEYGDPEDPQMAAYIKTYSPYQNVVATKSYPKVFFMTSTKDDRVHPGHARRMAKKMQDQGHEFYYFENIEGGHGGVTNNDQRAMWYALEYTYLWERLK